MDLTLTLFLVFLAASWLVLGIGVARGSAHIPKLNDIPPAGDANCPFVSILFAARDEEAKLPQALASLVALDYPAYEIIAVDDRSRDRTPEILDEFAAKHPNRLTVIHVKELPPGWLGKPHALQRAYEQSRGDWIVFTDADVRFAPDLLRRVMPLQKRDRLDHLTLFGLLDLEGFGEKVAISFFALGFHLFTRPGDVPGPNPQRYVGIGSFQLIRREVYERAGTHRRLALEVIDDMKLGKIMKQAGGRSGCAVAGEGIQLQWHDGLGNVIRGVTKNFFASADYRVSKALRQLAMLWLWDLLPFLLLPFVSGWNLALAAVAAAVPTLFQCTVSYFLRISPLYGLTHPLGAVIFSWMILRSMLVTLWRGGIVWRGTFYPLSELRKGIV